MGKATERLLAVVCGALAMGVTAALAVKGQPTWVVVATGVAAACTFVAGQLGLSKPTDKAELQRLHSLRPPPPTVPK